MSPTRRPGARTLPKLPGTALVAGMLAALAIAAAPSAVAADVAGGELYGYRLGEVVEGCGRQTAPLDWSPIPPRAQPAPFDELWALCTPLTHEVLAISARARVAPDAGRTLVDELVAVLEGKYGSAPGWKHDAQSRELLGSYDSIDSFENAQVLLRVSKRHEKTATDGRSAIVEIQLDHSTLAPRRDLRDRAERERQELLRRRAKAKGLDQGL
ncbi:MAG: hypothetical protein U0900_09125 [Myxococcota bacterium]